MTADTTGVKDVLAATSRDVPVGLPVREQMGRLNAHLMDIGFANHPIQCEKSVCDKLKEMFVFRKNMAVEEANDYKFIMDVSLFVF